MRSKTKTCLSIAALALSTAFLALGCGGDDDGGLSEAPYTVRILSQDVVDPAVDRIQIVFSPDLPQRFRATPDRTFFEGNVTTRVTATGEYAVFLERGFLDRFIEPAPAGAMANWQLDVPLYSEVVMGQMDSDLRMAVTFFRGDEGIAAAARFVEWPLPSGAQVQLRVSCVRPMFSRQCTNNDPLPMSDGGTMGMEDGGSMGGADGGM